MANYRTAFTGAQIDELLANIRDGKVPVAASAPATAVEGQIYYNSGDDTLYVYDGSEWTSLGYVPPVGGIPKSDLSEDVRTSLGKADTALQSFTETDPTVPGWAKAQTKPTYTAAEVGAATTSHTHAQADVTGLSDALAAKGTYSKPDGGIPASDLSSEVRTSLGKADTALQTHQDISGKEDTGNKVTSLSSASTDTQYPSAKCVYDIIGNIETLLAAL